MTRCGKPQRPWIPQNISQRDVYTQGKSFVFFFYKWEHDFFVTVIFLNKCWHIVTSWTAKHVSHVHAFRDVSEEYTMAWQSRVIHNYQVCFASTYLYSSHASTTKWFCSKKKKEKIMILKTSCSAKVPNKMVSKFSLTAINLDWQWQSWKQLCCHPFQFGGLLFATEGRSKNGLQSFWCFLKTIKWRFYTMVYESWSRFHFGNLTHPSCRLLASLGFPIQISLPLVVTAAICHGGRKQLRA